MQHRNLAKILGVGALTLSLSILPGLSASAQTSATPGAADTAYTEADDNFDWGWLGLLGLIGLAGLAGKKREPERYRDPNPGEESRTTTRF